MPPKLTALPTWSIPKLPHERETNCHQTIMYGWLHATYHATTGSTWESKYKGTSHKPYPPNQLHTTFQVAASRVMRLHCTPASRLSCTSPRTIPRTQHAMTSTHVAHTHAISVTSQHHSLHQQTTPRTGQHHQAPMIIQGSTRHNNDLKKSRQARPWFVKHHETNLCIDSA